MARSVPFVSFLLIQYRSTATKVLAFTTKRGLLALGLIARERKTISFAGKAVNDAHHPQL